MPSLHWSCDSNCFLIGDKSEFSGFWYARISLHAWSKLKMQKFAWKYSPDMFHDNVIGYLT